MIRIIYWLTALFEFLLILVVLFIFIITDARTIKLLAKESLASSNFTYEEIEGNFFTGLELRGLSYNKKPLFDSATVHWNPLALLNNKIVLQEVEARGVELENILDMVQDFETTKESEPLGFDFSIILSNIHLDINPYIFEGVKFSDFLFETDRVELSKEFLIDTDDLYLNFDSDLVRVKLKGEIKKSQLFVEKLSLKEIDSKAITTLVKRLKQKKSEKSKKVKNKIEPFLKKINVKKIVATMKDVTYSPLRISKTKVFISDGEIDPYNNYNYSVKKIRLEGSTNFGSIYYRGYVKDSMIYAKGYLRLSKELFDKYDLPLNYSTLNTLNGTLRLNHYGVWIEANHSSKELLKIDNDFNLDVLSAKHKLHYDYSDNNLSIISSLKGSMPYANIFNIKNQVVIDEKNGFRYMGKIDIPKVKGLPKEISTYLLDGLKGEFKGNSKDFDSTLESKVLEGTFQISNYTSAILKLDSKGNSIELDRLTTALPSKLKHERASLESETFFDFKEFETSNTTLKVISRILNIDVQMNLLKPFNIRFKSIIPYNSILPRMHSDIKFASLSELEGELSIFSKQYLLHLQGKDLKLSLEYDSISKTIQDATLSLNHNDFFFSSPTYRTTEIKSNLDIDKLLTSIKKYYKIKLPKLYGQIDLDVQKNSKGSFLIRLKSQNIKYASDKKENTSLINIYDIDTTFTVDNQFNIEIERYKFRIDENGYMNRFFSDKKSYLSFGGKELFIKELWINNQLLFTGAYNFLDSKGNFNLQATQYSYKNQDFDFLVDLSLDAKIDKEQVDVSGDVDIFGNLISYEVAGSDIVEDSDIIIFQEVLQEEESALDNLRLDLKINSKKPLKYISKDTNIEFFNDLSILKNDNSDIIVMGMTTITKGYYQMENKYFTLDESHIYFAGDPKKPLLDIKANYKKDEYTVHIFISGSTEEPIVNFTAEPYLTQQEILSLIIFDGTGSSDGGGAEAYTLLGGTFAKGLIKSLGIDVDHLLLGTDENDDLSFEIGRKISKDITIIYQHENGRDGVKARIKHTENFETDIIIQPPNSSSVEFLYKYSK